MHAADHAIRESVGLPLGIRPINVMPQFVVHYIDPLSFRIVLAPPFPIFWMHEVNGTVFVRLSRRLPPVQVFVPFDARPLETIEATQQRDGPSKFTFFVLTKETGEMSIDHAALVERGQDHPHSRILMTRKEIGKAGEDEVRVHCCIVIVDTGVRHVTEAIPDGQHQTLV